MNFDETDNLLTKSSSIASEMALVLLGNLKENDIEHVFKVGSMAIASLLAGFVHDVFKNEFPDIRSSFVDEIIRLTKLLLQVKLSINENNPGEKH